LLQKIKTYFAKKSLVKIKKSNKRVPKFHNFDSAKHINILFDSRSEKKFRFIKNVIKEFEDAGKFVSALGYIEQQQDAGSLVYKKEVMFFSEKDVNWLGKPKDETIRAFAIDKADILLNLCIEDSMAVKFIAASSKADCIISGIKDDPYADFIIDVSGKNDTEYLVSQIKHYLQLIKCA